MTRRPYINLVLASLPNASAEASQWTSNGPFGGRLQALAIDPTTPGTLYAGTFGGLFKSTDSGATWSAINNGLTSTSVPALAIDPITPSTLYAGTDGDEGVFKSSDSGATWSAINNGLTNTFVPALAIDPITPSTLYAGTFGGKPATAVQSRTSTTPRTSVRRAAKPPTRARTTRTPKTKSATSPSSSGRRKAVAKKTKPRTTWGGRSVKKEPKTSSRTSQKEAKDGWSIEY